MLSVLCTPAALARRRESYKAGVGRQRGAATLFTTIIVLVLMTLIAFFANRSVIFESRTAANQYRSTKALEAAEAGIEWSLANLNSLRRITAACATSTGSGTRSFRDVYLDPDDNALFDERYLTERVPPATEPPASTPTCVRLASGTWSCACPVGGAAPTVAACDDPAGCPSFRVWFERVSDSPAQPPADAAPSPTETAPRLLDASLVRVFSRGCTGPQRPCVPGAAAEADGSALVEQVVKLSSGLATVPAAAITAKGYVDFGSNAITATNTDPGTNGITINAGLTVGGFINDSTIETLPGTPVAASLVGNDTSLASLTDDQMFQTFFGTSKTNFRNAASTTVVSCSGVCNTTIESAIAGGARVIWVDGNMTLNANSVFGSEQRPVMVVVDGNIEVRGNIVFYGVLYCQNSTWDNTGGGNAQVFGAAISEGNFEATGTPDPTYRADILANLNKTTGQYARVPGGWRDFR